MEELEKAAVVAALLEALDVSESGVTTDEGWRWRAASNRQDSPCWHPQSESAYRMAGRMAMFRARKPGRW
ncbi:MAG: hypothetical protein FJ109_21455 [Deltaproteobacteria bacterium]|nr:hypothetical protein [Deltaproteobacteria bacterium]